MYQSPASREARPRVPPDLIDQRDVWKALNQSAFAFKHKLSGRPLFKIEHLADLSERVFDYPGYLRYLAFSERSLPKPELKRILRESILNIGNNGRWLALHQIDKVVPEYAQLLDRLFAEIERLIRQPIRSQMTWGSMSIFMNAPALSVPYHFDHETNFFYRHNPLAGPYRADLAEKGTAFTLTPGIALHHPPRAAHKIQNGDAVSVRMSINDTMSDMEDRARVHQSNYCRRKLGLKPRPIGESAFWDAAKVSVMRGLSKRNPQTCDEAMYSGVERLSAPFRLAKALKQRARELAPFKGLKLDEQAERF